MIRIQNKYGMVEVSDKYLAHLLGETVSSSFGVVGMARSSTSQGLREQLKEEIPDRGIRVRTLEGELIIDLHIIVSYGVNIPAIVNSIANKATYTVERATGLKVKKVNVFIDDIQE